MLQIQGLIDQITPSRDTISTFYRATFPELQQVVAGLLEEMDLNNYTFYTKWYTNGLQSALPFLINHPRSANVRTANATFRRLVDYLHEQGLTVGAMVQIYTYERAGWGGEAVWGEWDLSSVLETPTTEVLAAADHPLFRARLADLFRELVAICPDLDYIFVEGEGQTATSLAAPLQRRLEEQGTWPGTVEQLTYEEEIRAYAEALRLPLDLSWSREAREFALAYTRANLQLIDSVLAEAGWRGQRGLVYHTYGVESHYMDRAVPSGDWWLLPWHYFGWDSTLPAVVQAARLAAARSHMMGLKQRGHRVCYIGDCTISPWGQQPLIELWQFSAAYLDGYLGMGTPNVDLGLRWTNVTPTMIEEVRRLYRERLFVKQR